MPSKFFFVSNSVWRSRVHKNLSLSKLTIRLSHKRRRQQQYHEKKASECFNFDIFSVEFSVFFFVYSPMVLVRLRHIVYLALLLCQLYSDYRCIFMRYLCLFMHLFFRTRNVSFNLSRFSNRSEWRGKWFSIENTNKKIKKYESLKMLLRCNLKINCKAAGDPKTFRKLLNSFSFVCVFFKWIEWHLFENKRLYQQ